jgi:23S rRNA pseudouridine2457 synthase
MKRTYLFYKPYDVLSQFTKEIPSHTTLVDFLDVEKDVYPIGRLDRDSEGLLLLSNDVQLNKKLLAPKSKKEKEYYVQVEGVIDEQALNKLQNGVTISSKKRKYTTLPCQAYTIEAPPLPDRNPPIRFRKNIPTSWISITLMEGKNRQVRKMCAKVGYPVLRLIRYRIEKWTIEGLEPGQYKLINGV